MRTTKGDRKNRLWRFSATMSREQLLFHSKTYSRRESSLKRVRGSLGKKKRLLPWRVATESDEKRSCDDSSLRGRPRKPSTKGRDTSTSVNTRPLNASPPEASHRRIGFQ